VGLLQTIKRGAKRLKDQIDPFDGGKTWQNPTPQARPQARPQVNPYSRTQYNQAVGGLSVAPVRNPALDIKPIPTAPMPDLTVTTAKTPDFSIGNTQIKPSLNARTAPAPQQGTNIVKEFAKQVGNTGQFAASNVALAGANIAQDKQLADIYRTQRDKAFQNSLVPDIAQTANRINELSPQSRAINANLDARTEQARANADMATTNNVREINAGIKSGIYDPTKAKQVTQDLLKQQEMINQAAGARNQQRLSRAGFDMNTSKVNMGLQTAGDAANTLGYAIAPLSGKALAQMGANQAIKKKVVDVGANMALNSGGAGLATYGQTGDLKKSLEAAGIASAATGLLMGGGAVAGLKQAGRMRGVNPTKLENAGPTTYSQFSATAQPSPARLTPLGESGGIQLPFAPKQNLSYSSGNGITKASGKRDQVIQKLNESGTLGNDNQPTIRNVFGEDVPNPNYIAPVDNPLGMNMDSYKTKAQNPSPEAPPAFNDPGRTAAASLTDEQASAQIVRDLGVSKAKADELISQYGRSETVARLYGSKDKLRSLGSQADAYATGTMKKTAERGQRSARQGMPSTTTSVGKPPLRQVGQETPKGTPDPEIPGLMRYDTPNPSLDRVNDLYGTSLQRQIESSPVARLMMEAGDPVRRAELARVLEEGRARELPPEEAIVKQPLPTTKTGGTPLTPLKGAETKPVPATRTPVDVGATDTKLAKQLNKIVDRVTKEFAALDITLTKMGVDPEDIKRKMAMANRGDYQMTPIELKAAQMISDRLDQARAKLAESGFEFDGQQAFYTPQVKKGTLKLPTTREEMMKFGYDKSRTQALDYNDIDYTNNPLIDYVVKAENRSLVTQRAVDDAARMDGRAVTPENVVKASTKIQELQRVIKEKANSAKVFTYDTVSKLNDIGKDEGYVQVVNTTKPGRWAQSPLAMLEQAGIYNRGIRQFENAAGYGSQFTTRVEQQGLTQADVFDALGDSLRQAMPDAEPSSIVAAVNGARRSMEYLGLDPADATAIYQTAFRNAATSEMHRLGKTTIFTDKKMRQVVNEQINGRLMKDAYGKTMAQNFDTFLSERINVALRGLNVVSAMFEMGDYANIWTKYGFDDAVNSKTLSAWYGKDNLSYSKKYGQALAHYASDEVPEVAKFDKIWKRDDWTVKRKIYETYRTTENKLLFFKYIEQHKTEMFFRAAEADYIKKGYSGAKLVDAVMDDYYKTMLPHKLLTANRIVGKFPKSTTQYLNWSLEATKRLGRTVGGMDTGGNFSKMNRPQRIAKGVGQEIVPKIGVATMLGVPIMQILGMRDFTGATTGDFTGISEEDKNLADEAVQMLSISPLVSAGAGYYFANRRNQIADERKAKGETYRAERNPDDAIGAVTTETAKKMLTPFITQYRKSKGVVDDHRKGYFANKDGRIQTEAPKGADFATGFVTGKQYTRVFKDYQDIPDAISTGKKVFKAANKDKAKVAAEVFTKNKSVSNTMQRLTGESTNNYKRPLTDEYTKAYKDVDKSLKKAMFDGGREYNKKLDDLKRNQPDKYKQYVASMDGNLVDPEYYKKITQGDAANGSDLTVFKMQRDRKIQLETDMNKAGANKDGKYDVAPIYKLPDDQLRQVLKEKSAPTGENLAIRNINFKQQWRKDLKEAETAFYKDRPVAAGDFKKTERVKEWQKYDDQLNELSGNTGDTLKNKYPITYQLKQYEFGSDQGKQIIKNNYAAWKAENDALDAEKLAVINKMRKIEGGNEWDADTYAQATAFEKTAAQKAKEQADKDAKYASYGSRGGKGGREDKLSASEIFNPYSKIKVGALNKKVSSSNIKRVALKSKVKKPSIRKTA